MEGFCQAAVTADAWEALVERDGARATLRAPNPAEQKRAAAVVQRNGKREGGAPREAKATLCDQTKQRVHRARGSKTPAHAAHSKDHVAPGDALTSPWRA